MVGAAAPDLLLFKAEGAEHSPIKLGYYRYLTG